MDIKNLEKHYADVFAKQIAFNEKFKKILTAKEYENVQVDIGGNDMTIKFTCNSVPDMAKLSDLLSTRDSFKADYDIKIKNNNEDIEKRDITIEAKSDIDFRSVRCISYLQNIFHALCKIQNDSEAA